MNLKEEFNRYGFEKILDYVYRNPDKNLPLVMDLIDEMSKGTFPRYRQMARRAISVHDAPYHQYIRHVLHDVDSECLKHSLSNIIVNAGINGSQKRNELKRKYFYPIPWVMRLSFDEHADTYMTQGEKDYIYIYLLENIHKDNVDDFVETVKKHPQSVFVVFTDGEIIDDHFISNILSTRNIILLLNHHDRALMDYLFEKKMYFGIRDDHITREKADQYIREGVYFVWTKAADYDEFISLRSYRVNSSIFIIDEAHDIDLLEYPDQDIDTLIKNGRAKYLREKRD